MERDVVLGQASALLRSGDFASADHNFVQAAQKFQIRPSGLLAYEIGICKEKLNDRNAAIQHYRLAADSTDKAVAQAALLGQIRVLLQSGQTTEARSLLSQLALRSSDAILIKTGIAAEVAYQWANIAYHEANSHLPDSYLSSERVIDADTLNPGVNRLLQFVDASDQIIATSPESEGIQTIGAAGSHPDFAAVSILRKQVEVLSLIENIVSSLEQRLAISVEAETLLATRTASVNVQNLPVNNLLDLLLEPLQLQWEYEEKIQSLSIRSSREVNPAKAQQLTRSRASQSLRSALSTYPDHHHAPTAFVALSNLAYYDGDYNRALNLNEDIISRYRESGIQQIASFNRAKCLLALERREDARAAFYHVVDQQTNSFVKPIAYLYLGEMYLSNGDPKSAVRSLTRAASLARDSQIMAMSAISLGIAYIEFDNPRMAIAALMKARKSLQDEPFANSAALLSAYSQYRTARTDEQMRRAGRSLTSAIVNADAREFFGFTGYTIMGRIYEELGMSSETARLYDEAVHLGIQQPLRQELALYLGKHYLAENKPDAFVQMMSLLEESKSGNWSKIAKRQIAEFALNKGEVQKCMNVCYELMDSDDEQDGKIQTLRLLGRAYESQRDHRKAAICFAGLLPPQAQPNPKPPQTSTVKRISVSTGESHVQ